MRHYIRHSSDGELVGCDICTGGWPAHADPRDPDTTDSAARNLRKYLTHPTFSGWAAYDCPCSAQVVTCQCPFSLLPNHYYNGVVIFPKPSLTLEVDGAPVEGGSLFAVPGSVVSFVIRAAAPDGYVAYAHYQGESVDPDNAVIVLTFNGGVSAPTELTVPVQGVSNTINGKSKYVREFQLTITGWA